MHCIKKITSPYESLFISILLNTAVNFCSREKQQFYTVDLSMKKQRVEPGDLGCFEVFYIHLFVLYFKYNYFYKYISKYIEIRPLLACKTTLYGIQRLMCFVICLQKIDLGNAAKRVLGVILQSGISLWTPSERTF